MDGFDPGLCIRGYRFLTGVRRYSQSPIPVAASGTVITVIIHGFGVY